MYYKTAISILAITALCMASFSNEDFKQQQKKYPRVRKAYTDKEEVVKSYFVKKGIDLNRAEIYLRAFKKEKILEVWAKNKNTSTFTHLKEFSICRTSGKLGPKRKQGDLQIPEGFYHINRFNPYSNFYLSLGINYPNKSDKILGVKNNLGGDIFIHGACVTIGCLPITNDKIKELYVICVEAKNNGQEKIPVTIFPSKLTEINYKELREKHFEEANKCNLWEDLKAGFDSFNETKTLPQIVFLKSGRHKIN